MTRGSSEGTRVRKQSEIVPLITKWARDNMYNFQGTLWEREGGGGAVYCKVGGEGKGRGRGHSSGFIMIEILFQVCVYDRKTFSPKCNAPARRLASFCICTGGNTGPAARSPLGAVYMSWICLSVYLGVFS